MKAMIGKVSLTLVFGIVAIINLSAQENSHGANLNASQELKPRIVVLTDIAPGERILLDISGSKDPDGDEVKYKLFSMDEVAASLPVESIYQEENGNFVVAIPENCEGKELHLICEATDSGSIPLTSYRRIILKIQ